MSNYGSFFQWRFLFLNREDNFLLCCIIQSLFLCLFCLQYFLSTYFLRVMGRWSVVFWKQHLFSPRLYPLLNSHNITQNAGFPNNYPVLQGSHLNTHTHLNIYAIFISTNNNLEPTYSTMTPNMGFGSVITLIIPLFSWSQLVLQ